MVVSGKIWWESYPEIIANGKYLSLKRSSVQRSWQTIEIVNWTKHFGGKQSNGVTVWQGREYEVCLVED